MVEMWGNMLAEDDAGVVALAVKKYVSVNKFAPSVAEIKDIMAEITHPELLPVDVAWQAARKAMALKKCGELPPLVREAVEAAGIEGFGSDEEKFSRSAFCKAYEPILQRAKERVMMGGTLTQAIDSMRLRCDDGSLRAVGEIFDAYAERRTASERARISAHAKEDTLHDIIRASLTAETDEEAMKTFEELIGEYADERVYDNP